MGVFVHLCVDVFVCVWVCVCVHLRKKKMRRGEVTEFVVHRKERKKKCECEINKIINTHATVTVHICIVIVAIVYLYTSLHPLMWMIFCSNCVKVVTFSILHIYAQTDTIAFTLLFSTLKKQLYFINKKFNL